MTKIIQLLIVALLSGTALSQSGNNNCANATNLVSNAAELCSQTTNANTVQAGEVVASGSVCAATNFNESVWYRFTATTANMYVQWELTGINGANWCPGNVSIVVYNTSVCMPNALLINSCESAASDGAIVLDLNGLVPGLQYLVQVGYRNQGACTSPIFCMKVGDRLAPCSCTNLCANGCGYPTNPTVGQVTASCPEYILNPVSDGGETKTYCYNFVAVNSTVSFGMIISSNCGAGNVSGLTWTIQTSACGGNVATGNLSNLSTTGLTVGQSYVLCYTYTIPTTCYHSSLYPYFVGTSSLPVDLGVFSVKNENGANILEWVTESEQNNDYFILEKMDADKNFQTLTTVKGSGNSDSQKKYAFKDYNYSNGYNYYRLVQVDFDGVRKASDIIAINNTTQKPTLLRTVNLLGGEVDGTYKGMVIEEYSDGSTRKILR